MKNNDPTGQTTELVRLTEALMERLHPEFDLYGLDAQNEASDQVDDIVLLARQHLLPEVLCMESDPMTATCRAPRCRCADRQEADRGY